MTFEDLQRFIRYDMRMSQVYQPVMLIELLRRNGTASVNEIAQAILEHDPTQLEYYAHVVKNMVGRVLTVNRGLTTKSSNQYTLKDAELLTEDQRRKLIDLCEERIATFLADRETDPWLHRRKGHKPVPGSIRYQVLSNAKFRCQLCGVSAEEKNLEVDHIFPKSLGGKDDLSNYQALCYSCNSAKRNTDDVDFRKFVDMYDKRHVGCLFCEVQINDRGRIVQENGLAYAIRDGFAVTAGHTLFIPKRHVADYFGLVPAEVNAINLLLADQKASLLAEDPRIDAFNIGMNCGDMAGQTIFHCHVHLIPRRRGDVENPRGGVRHIIPGKGFY